MTFTEAIGAVEKLRGHLSTGAFSDAERTEIIFLYKEILGRPLKECNCKNRFSDALIEIYSYLKKYQRMKEKCDYRLKAGVVIQIFGKAEVYTNDNLTNKVAKAYLKRYPTATSLFEVIPEEKKTTNPSGGSYAGGVKDFKSLTK